MKQRRLSSVFTTNYCEGEFHQIEVQVLLRNGLPRFDIIGLPQPLIREGKDRILAALARLGIELPSQKILVNLSPAAVPKQGSHFDLPILVAILKCLGVLPAPEERSQYYWGEVSLNGEILPFPEFLPHYLFASRNELGEFYVHLPKEERNDLAQWLSRPLNILSNIESLFESPQLPPQSYSIETDSIDKKSIGIWAESTCEQPWDHLRGSKEQFLLWTLVSLFRIHILIEGPPGCGKSTWAAAMKDLRTPLPAQDWSKRIIGAHSPTRSINDLRIRPFVAPHHSSSRTSIVGGGSDQISPGAISQAHLGTLFLDEIGEFARDVIESLREPLETKQITIARGASQKLLPADTQIIAAMNPCRCGRFGSLKNCICSTSSFYSYRKKLSEPLKNRFHMIAWWKFRDQKPDKDCSLSALKNHYCRIPRDLSLDFSKINLCPDENPRRQRLWLDFFSAWCRWHHAIAPSAKEQQTFNEFIQSFKGEEYESIL